MCADNCKLYLQPYRMSVYRHSVAVHFINTHSALLWHLEQ